MSEETTTAPLAKRSRSGRTDASRADKTSSTAELSTSTSMQASTWCSTTFGPLLEDSSTHDIVFKTSDGDSVGAHRLIVAAGSPVFRAMLYGNMRESSQKEIDLPTTDTETLNKLLTFLYTGKVDVDSDCIVQLLEGAHYFDIASLVTILVDFFRKSLMVKDIFPILEISIDKSFDWLFELCLEFMYNHAEEVAHDENFRSLSSKVLISFCKSSDLNIRENDLFLAVVEWYKHNQDQVPETVVKIVFQEIRYPLIPTSDLVNVVRPTKMADPGLYTAALEYRLFPDKYEGPQSQIIPRKYQPWYLYKNVTPGFVDVSESPEGLVITRNHHMTRQGYALCLVQVQPTEQHPVHFKITFKFRSHNGHHVLVTRSYLQYSDSVRNDLYPGEVIGGIDLAKQWECECVGTVSIRGESVVTTIGDVSKVTPIENEIYLCLHMYEPNAEIRFSFL